MTRRFNRPTPLDLARERVTRDGEWLREGFATHRWRHHLAREILRFYLWYTYEAELRIRLKGL